MKQQYFILVLAHSFHGRLRRIHIPHQVVYGVLALALLGGFSVFGMVTSYARMAWKVANYNDLRGEIEALRARYQNLQKSADQTNQQLATLQLFATEVSLAYGIKKELEGPADISAEAPLLPSFNETIDQYDFLKSAKYSRGFRKYPRLWQTNVKPGIWPLFGRLNSNFGKRNDPFSGHGEFHAGVDIGAPVGTPVRVTADGIAVHAGWSGAYGRLIVVDHGSRLSTYYGHLSRIDVIPGQEVRMSQVIGASGRSGRASGPHLHYEVRQGGNPINPYIFLAKAGGSSTPKRDLPF